MERAILDRHHPIQLSVIDGTFTTNGHRLSLSRREHAFLALLAISSRPRPVADFGEALWPDHGGDSARNCTKVYAHRARTRLGRSDAVVWRPAGYALGDCVRVDTREVEAAVKAARTAGTLEPNLRREVDDALDRLAAATVAAARGLHEIEQYLARLAGELATLVFEDARRHDDCARAVDAGLRLAAFDPLEELGYELLIRAHLAQGDEIGAARAYRDHARVVRHELDAEPSDRLRSLLPRPGQFAGRRPENAFARSVPASVAL
jgi:DNA-binding SARP family transcriptional activator